MRRILHVITRSDWAGAQKVLYTIVKNLKSEFRFEVVCGPENGKLIEKLEDINVTVHVVKDLIREISPLRDLKAFFKIFSIIKRGKYDVVHTHSSKAGVLGSIAAKMAGVPLVVHTVHGWWSVEKYTGLKRYIVIGIERFASVFRDKIVFLCEKEREKALRWKISRSSKFIVIPNAVEPPRIIRKGKLREILRLRDDVKIVGNVARLDPPKNPLRFLRIAEKVLKRVNNVAFVWIGDPLIEDSLSRKVKEYVKNQNLIDNIFFIPSMENVHDYMADFDIMLITSDSEGMPLAVLEALQLGIPVVGTDVGCLSEMDGVRTSCSEEEMIEVITNYLISEKPHIKVFKDKTDNMIGSYKKLYLSSL